MTSSHYLKVWIGLGECTMDVFRVKCLNWTHCSVNTYAWFHTCLLESSLSQTHVNKNGYTKEYILWMCHLGEWCYGGLGRYGADETGLRAQIRVTETQNARLSRHVVSTGPLARGHLMYPPGHLLLDSTGPDWPPKFMVTTASGNHVIWSGPPKFVNHWSGWATNFQNLTISLSSTIFCITFVIYWIHVPQKHAINEPYLLKYKQNFESE